MPHCIIEYSRELEPTLDLNELLNNVYQGTSDSGLFGASQIKTRAIPYDHHLTEAAKADFIHIAIRILSGRTDEQKETLTASVLGKVKEVLDDIPVTIEVVDIHRSSYVQYNPQL